MNAQERALLLKEQGNVFFKEKKYELAIEKYTEAINVCPTISILYSNRSRCYRMLSDFDKSYLDAEKAVNLDDKNIKAYYLMGEALTELAMNSKDKTKIEMAIEKLKKSLRLCPSQGKSEYQEKFVDQIYKAKKKLWIITTEQESIRKKALRSYLVNLIETDNTIVEDEKDSLSQTIQNLLIKSLTPDKSLIPRSLICPLTSCLMKNPVCNEFGNSYSKQAYEKEISVNGKIDPISKKLLKTPILYPNINLKNAIEKFLEEHPWAYDEKV